jgi:hypothetical protein
LGIVAGQTHHLAIELGNLPVLASRAFSSGSNDGLRDYAYNSEGMSFPEALELARG